MISSIYFGQGKEAGSIFSIFGGKVIILNMKFGGINGDGYKPLVKYCALSVTLLKK